MGDKMRGGGEDVAGGTVVALEADDPGARKIVLEAQDVADLGPAPAVDRLVVVPHATDIFEHRLYRRCGVPPLDACGVRGALSRWRLPLTRLPPIKSGVATLAPGCRARSNRALPQQAQPQILRHVGVLIFVH